MRLVGVYRAVKRGSLFHSRDKSIRLFVRELGVEDEFKSVVSSALSVRRGTVILLLGGLLLSFGRIGVQRMPRGDIRPLVLSPTRFQPGFFSAGVMASHSEFSKRRANARHGLAVFVPGIVTKQSSRVSSTFELPPSVSRSRIRQYTQQALGSLAPCVRALKPIDKVGSSVSFFCDWDILPTGKVTRVNVHSIVRGGGGASILPDGVARRCLETMVANWTFQRVSLSERRIRVRNLRLGPFTVTR